MKRLQKLLAVLLCLSMIFSLAACQTKPTDTTAEPTSESTGSSTAPAVPSAAEVYDKAKAALDTAPALEITFTTSEIKTFRQERYEQTTTQTVTLIGQGRSDFESYLAETVTQGDTSFTSKEHFDGSAIYMDFEGALYRSDMTTEEYLDRLLPAALLDSSLYEQIYSEGNTLTFSEPTAGESWAMYETATLLDATGTATLSADGTLTATSYTASYRYGAVEMEISVKAEIAVPENTDLSANAPEDPAAYTGLEFIDAPKLAELAIAMVKDTNTAIGQFSDYFTNTKNAMELSSSDAVSTWGTVENLIAKSHFTYECSMPGIKPISNELITTFRDGVCSNGTSNAQGMKAHCTQRLTDSLPSGVDLSKADITYVGAMYLLELECNETFVQDIFEKHCDLYTESSKIPTENYTTRNLDITLSIDKYTGFPIYFTLNYEGRNTDNAEKITITYNAEISYELGSNDAYKEITGEDPPDVEPENKATPLFYHVTGADGEEMWLLGTIHIGDDRTAYLPQEIYDAFDAADALAVEVDIIAFQEQMLTDKKLQTQLSLACAYINGTTLKDHVDKEIYDATIDFATAAGIYTETLEYFKPGMTYSLISEYYDRYLPDYWSEKGVDYRLLTMAKEQNKTILNIENGLDQMKMFTTCSKALQEYMLAGALGMDAAENHDGTMELYEAWCSGDEALMRELVASDTSDLTEEERPLYEEYRKIMETDRNAGMLQKAIEYLQSGDVIFYAVGAAHVMAEDGLVNTLRDAGYTVEPVTYAD